ncbi:Ig-like domain-containing protein, partial [Paenibacillus sepulcri]|nr:Ig-like domain-containing protein [Paenibacillus sepulcri]
SWHPKLTITYVIPALSVELSSASLTMLAGEQQTLAAHVLPETAFNRNVIWSSDNEAVARVASDGTVTAISKGIAHITVTTADGGHTATADITVESSVNSANLGGLSFSQGELTESFQPSVLRYAAAVPDKVNEITIT